MWGRLSGFGMFGKCKGGIIIESGKGNGIENVFAALAAESSSDEAALGELEFARTELTAFCNGALSAL